MFGPWNDACRCGKRAFNFLESIVQCTTLNKMNHFKVVDLIGNPLKTVTPACILRGKSVFSYLSNLSIASTVSLTLLLAMLSSVCIEWNGQIRNYVRTTWLFKAIIFCKTKIKMDCRWQSNTQSILKALTTNGNSWKNQIRQDKVRTDISSIIMYSYQILVWVAAPHRWTDTSVVVCFSECPWVDFRFHLKAQYVTDPFWGHLLNSVDIIKNFLFWGFWTCIDLDLIILQLAVQIHLVNFQNASTVLTQSRYFLLSTTISVIKQAPGIVGDLIANAIADEKTARTTPALPSTISLSGYSNVLSWQ